MGPQMLNSYSLDDVPMYFARLGIVGCVAGAYPVFTIMARDLLYKSDSARFRFGFALGWYAVSLVGAMILPGFDLASKVIGSMAALLIFVSRARVNCPVCQSQTLPCDTG